jgi:hypothetical protein
MVIISFQYLFIINFNFQYVESNLETFIIPMNNYVKLMEFLLYENSMFNLYMAIYYYSIIFLFISNIIIILINLSFPMKVTVDLAD